MVGASATINLISFSIVHEVFQNNQKSYVRFTHQPDTLISDSAFANLVTIYLTARNFTPGLLLVSTLDVPFGALFRAMSAHSVDDISSISPIEPAEDAVVAVMARELIHLEGDLRVKYQH